MEIYAHLEGTPSPLGKAWAALASLLSHLQPRSWSEDSDSLSCLSPAEKRENVMFVLPLHGGHLGFFEGSVLFPEPLTWMDKLVVEYANAICQWERNKSQCSDTELVEADLE